jgi:hypothetical protein
MDPTSHIPTVKLFHYLIDAMPLSDDEQKHLESCEHCKSILEDYKTYINGPKPEAA